ncbi:dirigent protein 24-like [Lolium rigidum]|uniref:dirigent protein 24-like n=1 Tax=Lolium rigidum TaxID=89674 RepID=UPI001F5D1806|nr:dirigent protein 24-like [Lolium rigidum]
MVKVALCLMVALAVASCAFAGRVLDEHPAATPPVQAPLPVDPLQVPTEPSADPVVVPVPGPAAALPLPSNAAGAAGAAPTAAEGVTANGGVSDAGDHPPLTFFMHDILGGGSRPMAALMVTGVVASAADLANGNGVFGSTSVNFVADNSNNNIPSVNAGDMPTGAAPQNALFGTTTIIDEDLTESHELGAAVVGSAQGFHVATSKDGISKTVVLTAMFGGGEVHGDTLSFVGVHRMAAPASHVTIIGGTGKYQNAKGFAAIQTLQTDDQHTTDGGKNMLQFNVHLS